MSLVMELSSTLIIIFMSRSWCVILIQYSCLSNPILSTFSVSGRAFPFLYLRCSFSFRCYLTWCNGTDIHSWSLMCSWTSLAVKWSFFSDTNLEIHLETAFVSINLLHLILVYISSPLTLVLNSEIILLVVEMLIPVNWDIWFIDFPSARYYW